jgi:hypothetical protein
LRPRAKVEAAVRIVERLLLGRFRHRFLHSLAGLDVAIQNELIRRYDVFKIRWLGVTRRALFEEVGRPHLTPLPMEDCVYADRRIHRANLDYHLDIDGSCDSGPFAHARPDRSRPARAGYVRATYHRARAHALEPSAACRLDADEQALGKRKRSARARRCSARWSSNTSTISHRT